MSYYNSKGKYQKAYDFLFDKLIPPSGNALNNLGEILRLINRVVYRKYNDGDSYEDCVYNDIVQDFNLQKYPFDKEYHDLGIKLSNILSDSNYDEAINLILLHIMISLSSNTNIYNPSSNRLVPINSVGGRNALKLLGLKDGVFINYCGKNEEWMPESLRKEGIKITKFLSDETIKELKCDTFQEYTQPIKVTLSTDKTILSKKFSNIKKKHKKSVKENIKKMKERQKRRSIQEKKQTKSKVKNFNNTKIFYEHLKELSVKKRVDAIQNIISSKKQKDPLVTMLLMTLVNYKDKKVTLKTQRENKALVIEKLTNALNEAGNHILQKFSKYNANDTIYSSNVRLDNVLDKKLDNLLVEILGSSEAVDALYNKCCGWR